MKVYAVTDDLELMVWRSVGEFEKYNRWTDPEFITVEAASALVNYRDYIIANSDGRYIDGCIVYQHDRAFAHNMLVTINKLKIMESLK
jgi:hypothetical protein